MKKGLSAIVSTILLIVFVISLGVMIMSWSGGLLSKSIKISETKIGSELECGDVKIKLEPMEGNKIVIKNDGNKDLIGYIIREIDDNNNLGVKYSKENRPVKAYGADIYDYTSGIKKIEIIPRISIEGGEIVDCTGQAAVSTLK